MPFPKPIRYDHDTWLCVRNDPAVPKAIIRRIRDRAGVETFLVIKWDLDPLEETVMASSSSLEKANSLVRFEVPATGREVTPGYPAQFNEAPNAKEPPQPPAR